MELIELCLALILAVALISAAAKRIPIPLPLFFILGGVALSFEPHLRDLQLDPGVFFLLFIAPLLLADGWLFPKREFLMYRYSILMLAFGLVVATVLVVGYAVHALIPEIPLAAGFALGAVISPTDAVAVSAITERLKLPLRMTTVLNGESLIRGGRRAGRTAGLARPAQDQRAGAIRHPARAGLPRAGLLAPTQETGPHG
jgi:monovalent cation/hydrogen antiporter